jgi:hypothetical protein
MDLDARIGSNRATEADWSAYDALMARLEKEPGGKNAIDAVFALQKKPGVVSMNEQGLYKRLAGEVEARNVQSRMDMDAATRRATPPWSTEDVPRDQQIVRGLLSGDGPQMSASLPMDEASRMAPALKKWFGDSKVVDENGGPMVVYHGTASDFDTFAADAPSKHIPLPGFFFTPDPEKASWFASSAGRDGLWRDADGNIEGAAGANVMPVYLSIKNPVDVDLSAPMRWNDTPRSVIADVEKILQEAKRQGHDGAILRGWADGSGKVQYVAFKPEQIKSAIGNRGTYDPDDPSIIASYLGIPGAGLLPSATEDDRRGLLND